MVEGREHDKGEGCGEHQGRFVVRRELEVLCVQKIGNYATDDDCRGIQDPRYEDQDAFVLA